MIITMMINSIIVIARTAAPGDNATAAAVFCFGIVVSYAFAAAIRTGTS